MSSNLTAPAEDAVSNRRTRFFAWSFVSRLARGRRRRIFISRNEHSKNLFFTNYAGLTVEEITKLRTELRKSGDSYAVVKNTLFSIAAGEEVAKSLEAFLAGPTGVVFAGADPVAPAKALKTFSDSTKPLEVKAAWIDGKVVDAQQVNMLAALPPKIELLGRLVGSLKSPLFGLVYVLSGNQSGLVRVLNAIREQKSGAGESPSPA
jgi:large subunit ribosomal protein L10